VRFALVGDESRVLLSRRVPWWLQVTIRFLEIDEGGADMEVFAAERRKKAVKKNLESRLDLALHPLPRVSARYTSFNRIRMQCCGKFHLSEVRGSERAGWSRGIGSGRGMLGRVDPAVTLSRLCGPPAESYTRRSATTHLHIHCSSVNAIVVLNASR